MIRPTFILILLAATAFGQRHEGLWGTYESVANGFERYSIIILSEHGRFIYKSGVGGCQVEVTGTWTIENKKIKFSNDKEFLGNETVHYPNLGLSTWAVKKSGIKPDGIVDSGCVKDNKLHRKK